MQSSQDHFQVHNSEMNWSECNVCGESAQDMRSHALKPQT